MKKSVALLLLVVSHVALSQEKKLLKLEKLHLKLQYRLLKKLKQQVKVFHVY